jgi:GT2 family glycosyltransferase
MSESIAAVVVTYNRKEYLLECIQSLLSQSRKLDQIYIINNASTDGTYEYLLEQQIQLNPNVEIINMEENTGGAGGFYFGIKLAYEKGYDWTWVMDDDIEANNICLEEMLKLSSISQCIHPRKVWADGSDYMWGSTYNPVRFSYTYKNRILTQNPDASEMDIVSFEGMMLHRTVIEKIGFPEKRFFIAGDDIEYGLRIRQHTKIVAVRNALFYRKIKPELDISFTRESMRVGYWREYYYLRNLFLLNKLQNKGIRQVFWILVLFLRKTLGVFLYNDKYKMKKISYFAKAFFDGIQGNFGKTI